MRDLDGEFSVGGRFRVVGDLEECVPAMVSVSSQEQVVFIGASAMTSLGATYAGAMFTAEQARAYANAILKHAALAEAAAGAFAGDA